MGNTPNLAGDASEGRNTFIPMTDFAGYCTGISVEAGKTRIPEGARREAGRLPSSVLFNHTNITVARLQDDTELDMKDGGSVRFRYGVWDERRNETLNPTRDADNNWFISEEEIANCTAEGFDFLKDLVLTDPLPPIWDPIG